MLFGHHICVQYIFYGITLYFTLFFFSLLLCLIFYHSCHFFVLFRRGTPPLDNSNTLYIEREELSGMQCFLLLISFS